MGKKVLYALILTGLISQIVLAADSCNESNPIYQYVCKEQYKLDHTKFDPLPASYISPVPVQYNIPTGVNTYQMNQLNNNLNNINTNLNNVRIQLNNLQ